MKLSIITVCFNAEKVIARTIESVLNQTKDIYEYIFIDGDSQDNTVSIIENYRDAFELKGIKYIVKSEPDNGISDAFNKGIKIATGDLIGIINADDELMPKANQIISEVWNDIEADVYYGNCYWVDVTKHISYIRRSRHNLNELLYNMIIIHPSTFVKKKTYDECGMFKLDYKYCMDKELLYRFYLAGKRFQYIDAELTKFKAGGTSDTNTRLVYKEGSKMAMSYGEPYVKVKAIELKKIIRSILVNVLKSTPIYKVIKKGVTN